MVSAQLSVFFAKLFADSTTVSSPHLYVGTQLLCVFCMAITNTPAVSSRRIDTYYVSIQRSAAAVCVLCNAVQMRRL